jgi:hypothetical protein
MAIVSDAIALKNKRSAIWSDFQKIEMRNPEGQQFLQGVQYQRITPYREQTRQIEPIADCYDTRQ